jgi:predicted ATP-grasp superfamily ATP-dependent carboligase
LRDVGDGARVDAVGGRTQRAAGGLLLVRQGPRVLVTDAEHRSVLATCRGLAAAGYRVSTVAEERFALGHWARFSEERITLAGARTDPRGYVERLSQVLRRGEYDLIIPGSELSLLPISEWRDLVEPYTRLGLPSHEVVLRALDKPLLHSQAAAVDLIPPRSVDCPSEEEALAAARELTFPLLVKPAHSVTRAPGRVQQQRVQFVEDVSRLAGAVAAVRAPVTLQEYVSGTSIVSCAAVRAGDRLLGLTLARYARTYPPQVGSAALARTITPPRRLVERIEELLRLIGWSGIFELELLDLGENRFAAIDFNPRPFGWMALAIGAGANLPALWCDHVLRRCSVSPAGARVGLRYRWEDAEIRNALAELRSGHFRSAAAVLRPYRRVVHAHFRIDDPAPLVARMLSMAQKVGRRKVQLTSASSVRARSLSPKEYMLGNSRTSK